ncbi:MAG: hypothetical protein AB7P00_36755, partial [Sandaracinaceae bacterium]
DGGGVTGRNGAVATTDAGREPDAGGTVMPGGVGTPCTTDADCDGRFCSGGSSGVGYCTWICAPDVPCPDDGVCVYTAGAYGYCLLGCDPALSACPGGTVCIGGFGLPEPVCYVGCRSNADCAPGTECGDMSMGYGRCLTRGAHDGDPCAMSDECPERSFCAAERDWGFSGGICIREGCDVATGVGCNPGTSCVSLGIDNQICLPDCTSDADCRAGYECVARPGGASSVCLPRCMSDAQCSEGRRCDFLTSRCVDW